jgi:protein-disulfide isomerase
VNVSTPFIARTHLNKGDFVLVTKIKNDAVWVSNQQWNRHKMSLNEFKNVFGRVVLTTERPDNIYRHSSFAQIFTNLKPILPIPGLSLVFLAGLIFHSDYFSNYTWQVALLTLFKSAGLVTSVLLLVQSIDSNNPLIQKLCQGGGKTDCNAILSSKAAKVFDGLSWSEVGFFYFAGTWLALLFGGHSATLLQALAILNFISLPYTFCSIYYQARVARQWCFLCCTVQALLWVEFITLVTSFNSSFKSPGYAEISSLFIALISPVIIWILFKPTFLKLQQLQPLKQQLRKFKYNAELFNSIIKQQPKYAQPNDNWCIVLGKVEANNCITMVTNPYCPPCSKTHMMLDELLSECPDIQARIVFTANNTEEDIKTPVSRHLMALNELPDKKIVLAALHDWYEQKQKNYEAWATAYPIHLNGIEYHKIDKQKAWCELAEVTTTPTLLLNGYRLPDIYKLSDLKYMLG